MSFWDCKIFSTEVTEAGKKRAARETSAKKTTTSAEITVKHRVREEQDYGDMQLRLRGNICPSKMNKHPVGSRTLRNLNRRCWMWWTAALKQPDNKLRADKTFSKNMQLNHDCVQGNCSKDLSSDPLSCWPQWLHLAKTYHVTLLRSWC